MISLRKKEDPWNSIISGAVVGGFLEVRQGISSVTRGAVRGGCLFALLEYAGIMLSRSVSEKQLPQVNYDDGAPLAQGRAVVGTTPSWFDGTDKEVLESFDSPEPPTFDF